MMNKLVAVAGLGVVLSQTAFAANPDFLISHRVASFSMLSEKVGDADATETTSITWADVSGMEFAWFHEGWAAYAYPFNDKATLWIGKSLGPVEVGPTVQFDMKNIKDGTESTGFTFGAYAFYAMDLGAVGLEANLNPYYSSSSTKTPGGTADGEGAAATTVDVTNSTSGIGVFLDVLATKKIGDNLTWAGGLEINYASLTSSVDIDGAEDVDTTSTNIGLVLTEFRYGF